MSGGAVDLDCSAGHRRKMDAARRRSVREALRLVAALGVAIALGIAISVSAAFADGWLRPDRLAAQRGKARAVAAALR